MRFNQNTVKYTQIYKNSQRLNIALQIIGNMIEDLIPTNNIPSKVTQAINSGIMLFKPHISSLERIINGVLLALALIEIALDLAFIFTLRPELLIILEVVDLIYQSLMLGAWAHSETFNNDIVNDMKY